MTMAPLSVAPPPPDGESSDQSYQRLLGLVRDVRAEAQHLQESIAEIIQAGELRDQQARAQQMLSLLDETNAVFNYSRDQVLARLFAVRALLDAHPQIYDQTGDEITHIENAWERVSRRWTGLIDTTKSADFDQTGILADVADIDRQLSELTFHACFLTVPTRVNQHLRQVRIGQSLDFHATFADELPSIDERMRILRLLRARPVIIEGVIDVENGMVYHASPNPLRRLTSYLVILGAVVAGGAIIFVLTHLGTWLDLTGWPVPAGRFVELIVAYFFVLAGAAVHIGVDAIKQQRSGTASNFIALEDWLLWVHVKELSHLSAVLSLWVGVFGLAFLMGNVEWSMAFVVGYSIDSFVDLFLQRFTLGASKQVEAVQKQLSAGTP